MKPEYFLRSFELGKMDCWTLVCDIYKDEHGVELPYFPFVDDLNQEDVYAECHKSINLEKVQTASKGCIIVFRSGKMKWHAGYALDKSQYIHHSRQGVKVSPIPNKADIYRVLDGHQTSS